MSTIKDIPARELVTGISGHYVHGNTMTFGYVEIKSGADMQMHQHPHEQITYLIEGKMDMIIDGTTHPLEKGMYVVIPGNAWHSAVAYTDCKLIDVFSPVRQDYAAPVSR